MTVDRAHARHLAEHDGVVYAFCSIGCRTRFIKEPAAYLSRDRRTDRPMTPDRPHAPEDLHALRRHRRDRGVRARRSGPSSSTRTRSASAARASRTIEVVDATHFKATAKVGIGFISARSTSTWSSPSRSAPDRARHQGPRPGARAARSTRPPRCASRTAPDGATVMDWTPTSTSSGTLASVGARLIEGTANKMIGQTFDCMRTKLEA